MQIVETPTGPTLPYEAVERAERGAKLLDLLRPGWRDAINLETLDVASEDCCVLGQIHDSYSAAWMHADLFTVAFDYDDTPNLESFAIDHGFNCHHDDDPHEPEYDMLNEAWRYQVAGR